MVDFLFIQTQFINYFPFAFYRTCAGGRGIGFIPFFIVTWAYATRINKPINRWKKWLGTGENFMKGTRFNEKADTEGFFVVYPNAHDHGGGQYWIIYSDIGFISEIIRSIFNNTPLGIR